jgi:hypothetical protein
VYNEEKEQDNTSDSESSSSEYSTEDDDNGPEKSDDDSDGDSTEGKANVVIKNAVKYSEEAVLCEDELKDSDEDSKHETRPLHFGVEENGEDSANEKIHEVEVLPSLLFAKSNFGGKRLVEMIGASEDDDDKNLDSGENVNAFESVRSNAVEPDDSGISEKLNESEQEAVLLNEKGSEQELSCKISRLAVNE